MMTIILLSARIIAFTVSLHEIVSSVKYPYYFHSQLNDPFQVSSVLSRHRLQRPYETQVDKRLESMTRDHVTWKQRPPTAAGKKKVNTVLANSSSSRSLPPKPAANSKLHSSHPLCKDILHHIVSFPSNRFRPIQRKTPRRHPIPWSRLSDDPRREWGHNTSRNCKSSSSWHLQEM